MTRMRVIVPVHERSGWLDICLRSLELQDHPAFDVTIVDDASSDPGVERVARRYADQHGWQVVTNARREYALFSRAAGFAAADPADDELVCFVDGDDWLAHGGALSAIDAAFTDDLLFTSGGMRAVATVRGRQGRAQGLNELMAHRRRQFLATRDDIVSASAYRQLPWCYSHPHVFRPILWSAIDPADFRFSSGRWIKRGSDMAYMYPLLELAGSRFRFLEDVHYVYNVHAANDDVTPRGRRAQMQVRQLLAGRPRYRPLGAGSAGLAVDPGIRP